MINYPDAEPKERLEDLIQKTREIHRGLRQNLVNLRQNLEELFDQPNLLTEMVSVKRDAELRANNLESEVKRLREDLEALKELLGLDLKKP